MGPLSSCREADGPPKRPRSLEVLMSQKRQIDPTIHNPLFYDPNATCRKCGKGPKDGVRLTRSHVPSVHVIKFMAPGLGDLRYRVENLCLECHKLYTTKESIEVTRTLVDISERLLTLHEQFIRGELDPVAQNS
jgi:hypothetical protein